MGALIALLLSQVALSDEGGVSARVRRVDCVGSGIACTVSGERGTITVGGGGPGGGAPTDAKYVTQTCHADLSAEQCLGALTTGLVKVTTTTGVLSTAAAGTDYAAASHTHSGGDVTSAVAAATALASNPTDCAANQYATAIAANGNLTCAAVSAPLYTGQLATDVAIAVNATYVQVFSITPGASKNIRLSFYVTYIASANTVGMQFRVVSADTGYAGNCAFTTYGVSGTAASATAQEVDIIAIGTNPVDTAATAACAATPCAVDIECTLTSDASPGAIELQAQLETGTTSAPIKAGATHYILVSN